MNDAPDHLGASQVRCCRCFDCSRSSSSVSDSRRLSRSPKDKVCAGCDLGFRPSLVSLTRRTSWDPCIPIILLLMTSGRDSPTRSVPSQLHHPPNLLSMRAVQWPFRGGQSPGERMSASQLGEWMTSNWRPDLHCARTDRLAW